MANTPGVFLSHSHHDAAFVRRLASNLLQRGARVWYYQAEIGVGDSLFQKIEKAIEEMEFLGVVLSSHSVTSEWVRKEVSTALVHEIRGRKVKVLPLLIEQCDIPLFLAEKFYADFTSEEGYDRALTTVLQRMGLAEKATAREKLMILARRVNDAFAAVLARDLGSASPSWTEGVAEKDDYLSISREYERLAKSYEKEFQEFFDPLAIFRS